MYRSWKAQLRVLTALTLREIQSQNSSLEYGYAWALIDVCISIAVLTVLKVFIRALSPAGMPPILFLVTGILPWLTFSSTATAMEGAIMKNRRLLLLPGLTPLDFAFAKALQILCTYGSVFAAAVAVAALYFGARASPAFADRRDHDVSQQLGSGHCIWAHHHAAHACAAAHRKGHRNRVAFRAAVLRRVFHHHDVSGMDLALPHLESDAFHVEENFMRTYWFTTYQTPDRPGPLYVGECILGMAFLGLSLERYVRRRVPA